METEKELEKEAEKKAPKSADVGDMILIKTGSKKGAKGKVIIVRDSSVIVEIGKNVNTGEPIRTVVNHKNYKKV
ncbi:MAG: YkvS family protein [Bacillaceae bacterium]|nr:YkvS family protein [Bacillaceae bacterium]